MRYSPPETTEEFARSMSRPKRHVAVVMQRRALDNRWQSEVWEPFGVLDAEEAAASPMAEVRRLLDTPGLSQWLHPPLELTLFRDEAEGYFHNVCSEAPKVFVRWQMLDGQGVPELVTLSYDEASRWMDGSAQVDPVPIPPGVLEWAAAFVQEHYKPGPKKRIKPQSFKSPGERAKF